MSLEHDYTRRLLLLAGDVVDCEKELSELRNILLDHKEDWVTWAANELKDLEKTLARIKREYAEMIDMLSNIEGENDGHRENSDTSTTYHQSH